MVEHGQRQAAPVVIERQHRARSRVELREIRGSPALALVPAKSDAQPALPGNHAAPAAPPLGGAADGTVAVGLAEAWNVVGREDRVDVSQPIVRAGSALDPRPAQVEPDRRVRGRGDSQLRTDDLSLQLVVATVFLPTVPPEAEELVLGPRPRRTEHARAEAPSATGRERLFPVAGACQQTPVAPLRGAAPHIGPGRSVASRSAHHQSRARPRARAEVRDGRVESASVEPRVGVDDPTQQVDLRHRIRRPLAPQRQQVERRRDHLEGELRDVPAIDPGRPALDDGYGVVVDLLGGGGIGQGERKRQGKGEETTTPVAKQKARPTDHRESTPGNDHRCVPGLLRQRGEPEFLTLYHKARLACKEAARPFQLRHRSIWNRHSVRGAPPGVVLAWPPK